MAQSNDAAAQPLTEDERTAVGKLVQDIRAQPPRISDHALREINKSRNEVMVALINSHNPYTDNTGDQVSIFVGNPDPDDPAYKNSISQIELEVDGPYAMPMEVSFKGSPQKINKMLRIKYRYKARNLDLPTRPLLNPPHWVTAYLLIGFEDGGA